MQLPKKIYEKLTDVIAGNLGKFKTVGIRIGKDTIYIEVSRGTLDELAEYDLQLAGELEYFFYFAPKPATSWLIIASDGR